LRAGQFITGKGNTGRARINAAELAVLKNRQGRTGNTWLHYESAQVRFSGWAGPPPSRVVIKRSDDFE
jgi:hypothetical protein